MTYQFDFSALWPFWPEFLRGVSLPTEMPK